jgi:DNA-binding transcriptional regulator YdaS (Cro superfamily)|uniref:Antitoxin of bacterial toxin-antitoxin system, YdaS/YdaT n=1 Tax=Podoviridae sp. ctrub15 TaxID=2826581 RepID=A0A8S5LV00_9CAUD|nr:MAG TPA: Putative antitoxin of bacterial toxin-antitoxin system, YdaS/YdaT [Podoviridae sp. ctrub15]
MNKKDGLKKAIETAGNMSNLARACNVKPQSVRGWVLKGEIPLKRCKDVEKATGIPRQELRPDYFA